MKRRVAAGSLLPPVLSPEAVEAALADVESLLSASTRSDEPILTQMASRLIQAGGKRLRPRIAILSYAACGGRPAELERAVAAAAAAELIHSASLVHDDIIDQSPLRRGLPTVHVRYGLPNAILAGDFLFTRGFALAGQLPPEVVAVNAEACVELAEGELLEQRLLDTEVTEETYLQIIRKKTAAPIRACAAAGAILAGAPRDVVEQMARFGAEIGIAFQIADDVLDIVGKPEQMGKIAGQDAKTGVLTLPVGIGEDAKTFRDLARTTDPAELRRMLEASGAIDRARRMARQYAEGAKACLAVLPASPHKDTLLALADRIVDRQA